jgi:hypothetical protein
MGLLSGKQRSDYGGSDKDRRKGKRRSLGSQGWVRMDRSFAVLPCKILETSDTGVRISLDRSEGLTDEFTLLATRSATSGRRAKVKWRRGLQVGAQFV